MLRDRDAKYFRTINVRWSRQCGCFALVAIQIKCVRSILNSSTPAPVTILIFVSL